MRTRTYVHAAVKVRLRPPRAVSGSACPTRPRVVSGQWQPLATESGRPHRPWPASGSPEGAPRTLPRAHGDGYLVEEGGPEAVHRHPGDGGPAQRLAQPGGGVGLPLGPREDQPEVRHLGGAMLLADQEFKNRHVSTIKTYRDLRDLSRRAAQGFLEAGVNEQDRVAFLDRSSREYFPFLFGAGMINADRFTEGSS